MGSSGSEPPPRVRIDSDHYAELRGSAEFRSLRRGYFMAGVLMTVGFLGCYFVYVVMSVYMRGVMTRHLAGNVDVGLVFGAAQIVVAFMLAWGYGRYVHRRLDPLAERIRARAARGSAAEEAPPPPPPIVPRPRHQSDGPPEGFYADLFDSDPYGSQGEVR